MAITGKYHPPLPPNAAAVADAQAAVARVYAARHDFIAEAKRTADGAEDYTIDTNDIDARVYELEAVLRRVSMAPEVRYVNAYEVTRRCGGQEEGGWFYDVGTPLASVPVVTDEEQNRVVERLHILFDHIYADRRTRFSAIGEEDLDVVVEDHVAMFYPDETPHYE